jgi:hypothetical protein
VSLFLAALSKNTGKDFLRACKGAIFDKELEEIPSGESSSIKQAESLKDKSG